MLDDPLAPETAEHAAKRIEVGNIAFAVNAATLMVLVAATIALIILVIIAPKGPARNHAAFAFAVHSIPLTLGVGLAAFCSAAASYHPLFFLALALLFLSLPVYSLCPLSSIAFAIMAGAHARVTPSPLSHGAPGPRCHRAHPT